MSNNRLFVGGLNSSVQEDDLKKLFSEHGEVGDAYVNPSGYGFVTFSDGESAQRAVDGLNGYDFMGQTIRVEVSKPRDGGGRGGSRGGGGGGGGYQRRDDGGSNKLYVGNLNPDASKDALENMFSEHGDIASVWLATNPPGFGFVTFRDTDAAKRAANSLDGAEFEGQNIKVQVSRPRTENRGGGGYRGGRGGGGYGGGGGGYGGGGGGYGGSGYNGGHRSGGGGYGRGHDDGEAW